MDIVATTIYNNTAMQQWWGAGGVGIHGGTVNIVASEIHHNRMLAV